MELESLVMLWLRLLQDLSCRAFWTRHAASFFIFFFFCATHCRTIPSWQMWRAAFKQQWQQLGATQKKNVINKLLSNICWRAK